MKSKAPDARQLAKSGSAKLRPSNHQQKVWTNGRDEVEGLGRF
jgi:hypothetical protein